MQNSSQARSPAPAARRVIQSHYEETLALFGPGVLGVDWPDMDDLETRFRVMLSGAPELDRPVRLLDVGCGVGLLFDHLATHAPAGGWTYAGLDISSAMVDQARARHPYARFMVRDLIAAPLLGESFDYALLNGVFTVKRDLSQAEMVEFVQALLRAVWTNVRYGLAFNVMTVHLDRLRDDLFHWPIDEAVAFATRELSPQVRVRADYGLQEYTTFVYREPNRA